jgi:hypothetical protein
MIWIDRSCRSGRVEASGQPGQPGGLSRATIAGIRLVPEAMSCPVMQASCQPAKTCAITAWSMSLEHASG